jgi:hypothetical protein
MEIARLKVTCKDGDGNNHSCDIPVNVNRLALIRQGVGDISGETSVAAVIGEKIDLSVMVIPPDESMSIEQCQWNEALEGEVTSYIPTQSAAPSPGTLTGGDLAQNRVVFYWTVEGSSRVVSCDAVVNSVAHSAETEFDVASPLATMSATPGTVGYYQRPLNYSPLQYKMTFTGPGILFYNLAVDWPSGFSGETALWQRADRVLFRRHLPEDLEATPPEPEKWQRREGTLLADTFPYASDITDPEDTQDSPRSEYFPDNSADRTDRYQIEEEFTTWLMWKPDGEDSIWVPLKRIKWSWKEQAKKQASGSWEFLLPDCSVELVGSAPDGLPVWAGEVHVNMPEDWADE